MAEKEKIRVKVSNPAISEPKVNSNGNWIDLRAAEDVQISKGDFHNISLGVAMELPEGYEAIVAPRSSTFNRYGILMVNGIGIIDNSYNGDGDVWKFPALATRDTIILEGERICQFRIVKSQPEIDFEVVGMLGNADRGGFGSTGVM